MGKLFNLKKWLTVEAAARHLAIVFGEEVTQADVLRLALDGKLKLSINFVNGALARRGEAISFDEACEKMPRLRPICALSQEEYKKFEEQQDALEEELIELEIKEKGFWSRTVRDDVVLLWDKIDALDFSKYISQRIDGIWDLSMYGKERSHIEHIFQRLSSGVDVVHRGMDGVIVIGDDGSVYQLLDCYKDFPVEDYFDGMESTGPMQTLPDDSVLVVRTATLGAFEQSINGVPTPTDRAHVSDKLAYLNQAATKFWAKVDRDERSTHTDNATIVAWLIERGYSATLAEKAATIIRPEWAPTGRKPEE